jgi:hypothetical protein
MHQLGGKRHGLNVDSSGRGTVPKEEPPRLVHQAGAFIRPKGIMGLFLLQIFEGSGYANRRWAGIMFQIWFAFFMALSKQASAFANRSSSQFIRSATFSFASVTSSIAFM